MRKPAIITVPTIMITASDQLNRSSAGAVGAEGGDVGVGDGVGLGAGAGVGVITGVVLAIHISVLPLLSV